MVVSTARLRRSRSNSFLWLDRQSAGTKRSLLRILWHAQISELVGSDNLLHILKEGAPGPGALLSNEFAHERETLSV